ncbi:folylpolyglutamate synthetase [Rhodospirillum rubrum F11]|uniref:Dihydrofolate synthase/folylpolyglutamate synthase n=4 Tax=Rhodospirillum rubrum TaxID=1085 RepID=Q2RNS0_RHORT|nr:folylpolyglutamate synthase/dihydrofolate synthase family protein [Rhodospirillum rubrum]ABC24225.1 Folylpolyglutamate synthetase [Rhodospirillum rubrum ATCC 11170]AEO49976.1 folylpolyglutamate synthetase [Rhodospirillum rubrum F11]MBK5955943.1 bifunctional folylpolyglutamate synthase/dihydrofolate synthase [Rhodospirillum rubrum]QXG80160.1 bifunctional folylpolyglutamate synthase/dihydrofolate synthase [Rhodospirillum rubrum]
MNAPDGVLARLMGLHPKVIDLSLGRVERLLAALGHPERALPPVIHVAGTNGKGSVVATCRALLEAAGYRVHVYTSPHLVRFGERIRLAGTLIADEALRRLLEEVESANAKAPITFFEVTTAAAFLAFSRSPADVTLLEVGLGGRLDATNVIADPAVCAVTPIDLDHQQYLGSTLTAIAGEKAGILKAGAPAVIAPQPPEAAQTLAARATAVGAPTLWAGRDWSWERTTTGWRFAGLDLPLPVLAGPHQLGNAAQALAVIDALEARTGLRVEGVARARGLRAVDWPARLQRLDSGPLVERLAPGTTLWLDGGHNPHAGRALAAALGDDASGPLDVICGMLDTKDAGGFLGALAPLVRRLRCVAVPDGQTGAGLAPDALAGHARAAGIADARSCASVAEALTDLGAGTTPPPAARILICGSLYLAGTVLAENGTPPR